jgi:hypothetical protein
MAGWLVDRHSGTLSFLSRGVQHRAQPGAERGRMASRAGRFALPCCAAATLATHKGLSVSQGSHHHFMHLRFMKEGSENLPIRRRPTGPAARLTPSRTPARRRDPQPPT